MRVIQVDFALRARAAVHPGGESELPGNTQAKRGCLLLAYPEFEFEILAISKIVEDQVDKLPCGLRTRQVVLVLRQILAANADLEFLVDGVDRWPRIQSEPNAVDERPIWL